MKVLQSDFPIILDQNLECLENPTFDKFEALIATKIDFLMSQKCALMQISHFLNDKIEIWPVLEV